MQMMMPAIPDDMSLDAWSLYRRWLNWTPELSQEEEHVLFARLGQGSDEGAEERLVASYQKLVLHIAWRFRAAAGRVQCDVLDLVQDGNIGLLEAIRAYAREQCHLSSFQAFAGGCIRRAVIDALCRCKRVHMSGGALQKMVVVRRVTREVLRETGEVPSPEVLAQMTGMSIREVQEAIECWDLERFDSLQRFDSYDEEYDRNIAAPALVLSDAARQWADWQEAVEQALQVLTEKQRTCLRLRYGLNSPCFLPVEIAAMLGISRGNVADLERKALAKLASIYPDPAALLIPPPTCYYTVAETLAVLGIGRTTLHVWASHGRVQSFDALAVGFARGGTHPGDKCFLKDEIDALAAARQLEEVA